jgi:broad specificity phosphatase PhoE
MIGWSDHPLSDLGRAQAAAVAARLAPLGPLPVLCSDLQRAVATAEAIAAAWGGTVEPDARWREVHCGALEDCPWSAWEEHPGLAAAFDADPLGAEMPGGESLATMQARVMAAFADLLARPEPAVVVVTHDGPIRALLAHCLQVPPARFWALVTDHAGLTHLSARDGWIAVRTVNDRGHLGDPSPRPTGEP